MLQLELQAHRRPAATALREALRSVPGWRPARGERTRLTVAGRELLVEPLATRAGAEALLCESLPGRPLADHRRRRLVRGRLRPARVARVLVFADAAHTAHVWSWVAPEAGGLELYREHSAWAGPDAVLRDLLREAAAGTGATDLPGCGPAVLEPVARSILVPLLGRVRPADASVERVLRAAGDPGAPLRQRVQDLVAGSGHPRLLRSLWRALGRLTVLDPACGEGAWLLRALAVLEPVYLGCLDRMQIWIDEARRGRARRRPELFADFRRALQELGPAPRDRRVRVRGRILRRNLFGADPDGAAVEAARERLRLALALPGQSPPAALPDLDCNLRVGAVGSGLATEREVREALHGGGTQPAAVAAFLEEVEVVGRALRMAHRSADRGEAGPAERVVADAELACRRGRLAAELDRCLGAGAGAPGRRPVHAFVEFHAVAARGGFAVVRREDG
jgi:hypothetical protein